MERFVSPGAIPVRAQLTLMDVGPIGRQAQRSSRELTRYHPRIDLDDDFMLTVANQSPSPASCRISDAMSTSSHSSAIRPSTTRL